MRDQRRRVFVRSGAELALNVEIAADLAAAAEASVATGKPARRLRISSTARWTVGAANVA